MKNKLKLIFVFAFAISTTFAQKETKKAVVNNPNDGIFAEFDTSKGKIIVKLEYNQAPITVANFVSLAEGTNKFVSAEFKDKPFYNGLKFHRVIPGFMIQGGDPLGNGAGNPGYKFKDEINPTTEINKRAYKRGVLAMANSGPNTNGSQFFIMHKDYALPLNYSIFGSVVNGIEFVDAITNAPRNEKDKPNEDQIINKITIKKNGSEAKNFDAAKIFADYFANKDKEEAIEKAKKTATDALEFKKKKDEADAFNTKYKETALKEFAMGKTTASGIKYIVLKEGTGATPIATSNVKVHYTGSFLDGKVFDSSVQRGTPIDFGLNQVIPGWTEGVQLMKEGGKYKFYIPYSLAYGERGYPGAIPPNSDLIFEVELLKINTETK